MLAQCMKFNFKSSCSDANTAMLNSKSTVINIGPTLGQHCIPDANEPVFMLACPLLGQRWANVSYPTPTLNQQTNQNPTLGQRSHAVWEDFSTLCFFESG